ncbi:hypothetical protein [Pedobacter foliorum]|uniref:hypothetical protein n=1 Tax=Pedobacter foliorum TaxID=2739058 RepID=UPI001564CF4A|nr:hypothetical protein [Pedobacter foliorum]NRF39417.1 hypothetical protein [Pedobacter foliorum]
MKNAFKFGFLALAISLSVAACNSEKKADTTDTSVVDSSAVATVDTTVVDTAKKDSAAAVTAPVDSAAKH